MQFNNREFETNARTSLSTLAKIKEGLNFGSLVASSLRGLETISNALSKIGLKTPFAPLVSTANKSLGIIGGTLEKLGMKNPFSSGITGASEMQRAAQAAGGPAGMGVLEGGVTAVSSKFIALSTIAITALSNITNKAVNAGTSFVKSFTVAPIMDGLREYETTLQSIQTVQANTDAPLKEVEDSLQRLNNYSDTTIYNFGQMAKNVGTFTAAGVDLETSVASIQGIANIAALSGSSAEQAATAMYQLSQAIAAGKVGLMDWNSVVNAGMGGKKLQNALLQTAVAMGEIEENSVKLVGPMKKLTVNGESFRESIMAKPGEESWLSSEILVNTLSALDGRFSVAYQKAQLTEQGVRKFTDAQIKSNMAEARANLEKKNGVKYSDEQYAALLKMAEASTKAAQDVKTLGQVFSIARETIGSGWAASFKSLFGNLDESKKLFTGMSNGLGDLIRSNALARNKLLVAWKDGGGRDTIIDGLKNSWEAVQRIMKPVMRGFRDIFPRKNVDDLLSMSDAFKDFTKNLIPSRSTMKDIRDISSGFFSVLSIGKTILSGAIDMFKSLFTSVGGGKGDFLDFAANVGRMVTEFDNFLKNSGVVEAFFDGLASILSVPLGLLKGIGELIGDLFSGFDSGTAAKVGDAVDEVGDKLSGLQGVGERLKDFFKSIGKVFEGIGEFIGRALVGIGDIVAGAFTPETFAGTLDAVNTGLLAALVLLIRNFFNRGVKIDLGGGLFEGIRETLGEATGAFKNMQNNLKADILLKLAVAIGAMALALLVLSSIEPGALTKALAAMTGGFAILIGAMATLIKVMGPVGLVQLYVVTSAMTKMAFAIVLLAGALKILASVKFGDMLRGLLGLSLMMKILAKAMVPLAAGSPGMLKAAASLILVGIAISLLAFALKIFATMSWEEMIKGLAGLTGTLVALSIGLKLMPPLQAEALGLIALGIAINLIAIALKVFATMSWEEMAKGLVALAGSLAIISAAINSMPKTMMLQAAALLIVSGALVVLSGALKIMGKMGWEEIAKGLVTLAGALAIIAGGLRLMGATGPIGAAALLVVAIAMNVLLPVLLAFAALSWESILKSMTMLAGVFIILGAAGYLLAPVVLVIAALAGSLLLIGAAFALAGAGALMLATAFGIVVGSGIAGLNMIVALGGALAESFGNFLDGAIRRVIKATPQLARMFSNMLIAALIVIRKVIPQFIETGLTLIDSFLASVDKHIPNIVKSASSIASKFMGEIGKQSEPLADSAAKMIIKFIYATARAIENNDKELGKAGGELALALVNGIAEGLYAGAGVIKDAALKAAKDAFEAVKDFFKIGSPSKLMRDEVGKRLPQGMALGVKDDAYLVENEIQNMGSIAMTKMGEIMQGVNDAFSLDPNLNPTITPVLDLSALTQEANKMSSILATAPIMAGVSYQTAADISAMTQVPSGSDDGPDGPGSGGESGGGDISLTLELHSPKPIDSVETWRAGKTLISVAKEALK